MIRNHHYLLSRQMSTPKDRHNNTIMRALQDNLQVKQDELLHKLININSNKLVCHNIFF